MTLYSISSSLGINSPLIKSSKDVWFFAKPQQPLSAHLVLSHKIIRIGPECIKGIPSFIQQDISKLRMYLRDAYVKVVHSGQNGYHIRVSHGLKGGMEEEKVPASLFRRQMTTSSSSASSSSQTVVTPPYSDVLPFSSSVASSSSYDAETSSSSSSSDVLPCGRELTSELIGKLKMAVEQAKQAQGKDIIAFVGVTASGKSTAINHLLGCEMEEKEINGSVFIDARDPSAVFTKIGHRGALSETEFTLLCHRPDFPYVFADCGGFLDTRGEAAEILTSISMKLTLENAKSVKIILCIQYNSLMDQRAIASTEALRALGNLLVDIDSHKHSVGVLLTRPPMIGGRRRQRLATVEDAKLKIAQIISELEEHVQKLQDRNSPDVVSIGLQLGLYRFLLREEGKYLALYDPLEDSCRTTTLSLFDQMEPIIEPKGKFRTTLSDRTTLHLSEQITGMAGKACPLYEALLGHRDSIHDLEDGIVQLNVEMQSMDRWIEGIGKETNDPEQIETQQNAMREEQTSLIEQQTVRIAQIDGEIVNTQNELHGVSAQIDDKEAHGDEPESYYQDSIDNFKPAGIPEAVVIGIISPLLAFFSFFGGIFATIFGKKDECCQNFVKGCAKGIAEPFERALYCSLTKVFQYNGSAPLHDVRLTPNALKTRWIYTAFTQNEEEKQCWFDQVFSTDRTSHTVRFSVGQGYPVEARVEYIVRRRDIPNEIAEMNALRQQEQQLQDTLARLTQSKADAEAEKRAAEELFNATGTTLEKLERYIAFRDTYPQRIQESEARLSRARFEGEAFQQQIESQKADFQFASDYLELSGDVKLLNSVVIKRFLKMQREIYEN